MNDTSANQSDSSFNPNDDTSEEKRFPWGIVLLLVFIPIAFAVGIGVGYIAWGEDAAQANQAMATAQVAEQILVQTDKASEEANAQQPTTAAQQPQEQELKRYDVPVDGDPSIGPENAAITLIEFSDYQCPFCKKWHNEVFYRIREDYPDQVRIVYRDFPLTSLHPEAVPAAMAANCAYEQDAFWEFHEKLFTGELPLGKDTYNQYASDLGLDMQQFEECVSSEKYVNEVQADFQYAVQLGVQSTPTFFLNGIPLVGAQPYEVFQRVIELELAGELPK